MISRHQFPLYRYHLYLPVRLCKTWPSLCNILIIQILFQSLFYNKNLATDLSPNSPDHFRQLFIREISGEIIDSVTKISLPFVHIGIKGKNYGLISDDHGGFRIRVGEDISDDTLTFSMIGYNQKNIPIKLLKKSSTIELSPAIYDIGTVIVKGASNTKTNKLGGIKPGKTTTGQSGDQPFGFGGEWGIKVAYPGYNYFVRDISFHTRFNQMDSVLFRFNMYTLKNDMPDRSLLTEQIFVKSYFKDKWITKEIFDQNILIGEDVVISFETVQLWRKEGGKNHLFFTRSKNYGIPKSYRRKSSLADWEVRETSPFAISLTAVPHDP